MSASNDSGRTLPRVLVIAGSDSSGGAGLEADQKVIAAHGCYAMTATTALTAQNTKGVYGIHEVPVDFLRKQIDAVVGDVGVDVVKTGMLASAGTIEAVAQALQDHKLKTLVIDPVMIATTGAELLPNSASRALCEKLLPIATILTPNVPEANKLLLETGHEERPVQSVADLEDIAIKVQKLGSKWVLVKGGHSPFRRDGTEAKTEDEMEIVVNVLVGPASGETKRDTEGEEKLQAVRIEMPYQRSRNTHGTGCSLASAIASNLAKGMDMVPAVKAGIRYVDAAIRTAPGLGQGNGPLNHFHSVKALPFSSGHFLDYLLERPDVAPVWDRYIHHPFVMAMGDGTLPRESFKGYLMQDYVYLVCPGLCCSIRFCHIDSLRPCKRIGFVQGQEHRGRCWFGRYCCELLQGDESPCPILCWFRHLQRANGEDRGTSSMHGIYKIRPRHRPIRRLVRPPDGSGPMSPRLRRHRQTLTRLPQLQGQRN
ncbi:hypothetical protein GE21DRAFT_3978 [Neurospora crassa]|nr:hypothetical protein GE21DRAFT_3978 [Neurospora crassa]